MQPVTTYRMQPSLVPVTTYRPVAAYAYMPACPTGVLRGPRGLRRLCDGACGAAAPIASTYYAPSYPVVQASPGCSSCNAAARTLRPLRSRPARPPRRCRACRRTRRFRSRILRARWALRRRSARPRLPTRPPALRPIPDTAPARGSNTIVPPASDTQDRQTARPREDRMTARPIQSNWPTSPPRCGWRFRPQLRSSRCSGTPPRTERGSDESPARPRPGTHSNPPLRSREAAGLFFSCSGTEIVQPGVAGRPRPHPLIPFVTLVRCGPVVRMAEAPARTAPYPGGRNLVVLAGFARAAAEGKSRISATTIAAIDVLAGRWPLIPRTGNHTSCAAVLRLLHVCCMLACLASPREVRAQSFGAELFNTLTPASGGMAGTSIARPQDNVSAINGNAASLTQYRGTQFTVGGAGPARPSI